jgi:ribosome-associated heat shock protein Hsp15
VTIAGMAEPGPDAADASKAPSPGAETQRLDKWLWFARITKTRTLAALLIEQGKVRVNRVRAVKPSQTVRPGDVLTIALRGKVLVLRVAACGGRRGPPPEARRLYDALTKPVPGETPPAAGARPNSRERRELQRLKRPG